MSKVLLGQRGERGKVCGGDTDLTSKGVRAQGRRGCHTRDKIRQGRVCLEPKGYV